VLILKEEILASYKSVLINAKSTLTVFNSRRNNFAFAAVAIAT